MDANQIAEGQWQEFGERFSRNHQGWRAHIYQLETTGAEPGNLTQSTAARLLDGGQPLQEVRIAGDTGEIILTVGEDREEISYLIEDVVAIFSHTIGDAPHELRIDSRGGRCTLVQLHPREEPFPSPR